MFLKVRTTSKFLLIRGYVQRRGLLLEQTLSMAILTWLSILITMLIICGGTSLVEVLEKYGIWTPREDDLTNRYFAGTLVS